jgi:polysaccharide chain length determinant protein (PEP-CTERM system associated)
MDDIEDSSGLDIEHIITVLMTWRWWILITAVFIPLGTIAVVLQLPDRYESEATLLVVQQQISQRYVDPANTMSTADSVDAMTRTVLSRARLLGIIDASGLYKNERKRLTPERLVQRMRKDVTVEPLDQIGRDLNSFKVVFTADNPQLAQEVTGRLASLFIEENLKTRETQAITTTKFLTEQLEEARKRLAQQEQRLRDFKVSNLGELPEQAQSNLGTLTDLRIQLQNTASNLSRNQQQRISLESMLSGNLARLQSDRIALRSHFTPRHPEVLKKDQEIEGAQTLLARLNGNTTLDSYRLPDDPMFAQLKGQVEANLADSENLSKEHQRLRADIAQYQNRLQLTPVREQQLSGILRDHDLYRQDYADLLKNQLRSQLTTTLEEQQEGRRFRLVDPPTLPTVPTSPNRRKIS